MLKIRDFPPLTCGFLLTFQHAALERKNPYESMHLFISSIYLSSLLAYLPSSRNLAIRQQVSGEPWRLLLTTSTYTSEEATSCLGKSLQWTRTPGKENPGVLPASLCHNEATSQGANPLHQGSVDKQTELQTFHWFDSVNAFWVGCWGGCIHAISPGENFYL